MIAKESSNNKKIIFSAVDNDLYNRNMNGLSPLKVSENDKLRSYFMWHLIQSSRRAISKNEEITIPRQIIQFWNDINNIPIDVQVCIDSWKICEKYGFKHFLFNDNSARNFIKKNYGYNYVKAFALCKHPAMRADYFRLCYLYKYGGFYVDADDVYKGFDITPWFNNGKLKIQPLCYNTSTDLMVEAINFISDSQYSSNFIYYVNNDPLIAPPNHPLIYSALERSTKKLIESGGKIRDIQSTTGPGNLTASLVRYVLESAFDDYFKDITIIHNWDMVSKPKWPLEYRKDKRNWRIWDGSDI